MIEKNELIVSVGPNWNHAGCTRVVGDSTSLNDALYDDRDPPALF